MNDPKHPTQADIERAVGINTATDGAGPARRNWLLGGIGAAIVLLLIYWFTGGDRSTEYRMGAVTQGDMTITVTATGTLKPVNQVDVGAEISGLIAEVLVTFNEEVKKGEPIARLDTDQLEAQVVRGEASLVSARALLAEAQATAAEAKTRRDRVANLAERRTLSQQELEIAEATYARSEAAVSNAEAQVTLAEAALKIDKSNLEKAIIRSPIDGIVLDRKIEPGQTVASSFQTPELFTLAEDLRRMQLHVDVDEADVGQVRTGQAASFTVDAYPNRTFEATVQSVRNAPRTVQGVVTYEAVLNVNNDDLALRPGMTATSEIVVEQFSNTVSVPNGALRFTPPTVDGVVTEIPETTGTEALVWVLKSGTPAALVVDALASDGRRTAIQSEELAPGVEVLLDVIVKPTR